MTLPEVLGVVIATAVTIVLRWAAHTWPLPPKPKKRKKRKRDDDYDEEY